MPNLRPFRLLFLVSFVFLALAFAPSASLGQEDVQTQDEGAGVKQEFVRDANGNALESRTYDREGKLQGKVNYEYKPGYLVPQQTTTAYFPDGKAISRIARVTYDPNSNFLSETLEYYDQAGKHSRGQKIEHDPFTGIYRCAKWDGNTQKYQSIECPSSEEASGVPEEVHRITSDDAIKTLEEARGLARSQQKVSRMLVGKMITPQTGSRPNTVAVVLPTAMLPGKLASGSVVQDAALYDGRPDLMVVAFELPGEQGSDGSSLSRWDVEIAGSQPHPADEPFAFSVPAGGSPFTVTLRQHGDSTKAISKTVNLTKPTGTDKASRDFRAQALCLRNDVCAIAGPFTGNSSKAFVSIGNQPAPILAETQDAAYVAIPETAHTGQRFLLLNQGPELLAFPVAIAEFTIEPDNRVLQAGDHLLLFANLVGAEELPEPHWSAGSFPQSNLLRARTFVPGFQLPRETHKQREEREARERHERKQKGMSAAEPDRGEESPGSLLVVLKNLSADRVSWRNSKDEMFALTLSPDSFQQGEFRFKFVVDARQAGPFAIRTAVVPFLAPVAPQKFTLNEATAQK